MPPSEMQTGPRKLFRSRQFSHLRRLPGRWTYVGNTVTVATRVVIVAVFVTVVVIVGVVVLPLV
jgi:hypothetical protein